MVKASLHSKPTLKRLLLVLLGCLSLCRPLSAQSDKIHFGIQAGANVTTSFPIGGPWVFDRYNTSVGFTAGGFFQIDLGKRLFLHIELFGSSHKTSAHANSLDSNIGRFSMEAKYAQVGLPLGLGFYCFPKTSKFNLYVIASALGFFPQQIGNTSISVKDRNVEKQLFRMGIGGQLDVWAKYDFLSLGVRYSFGGTPLIEVEGQEIYPGCFSVFLNFHIF